MILFLYTNKLYEHQAISCIRSIENKITDDIKVVYFTIGFVSNFQAKNLIKIPIPERDYPSFNYYKAELSLDVMDMFPEEQYFIFTDADVLFSKRADFKKLLHDYPYPLASYGPHELPYTWERINDDIVVYNQELLMKYFNVSHMTVRYQWSCFYTFNRGCYEFFEELTSMCKNKYLLKKRKTYFPFHDETPFNICLWKRNATQSMGHIFVNTHKFETVKIIEEGQLNDYQFGKNIDELGADWEYVADSNKVIFYHGFKEESSTTKTLEYLLGL